MYNVIKRYKRTKQHLWFLSKQKINADGMILDSNFFKLIKRAYIIAPHMDDEIFGSFTLINLLQNLHKEVTIIYCISKVDGKVALERIKESKLVFSKVKKVYLNMEDSKLNNNKKILYKKLFSILRLENEECLYVFPEYATYNHKDHNVVNEVMNIICSQQGHSLILKTELIVPIKRSHFLPMYNLKDKTDALSKYKSQKSNVNYKKIVRYLASNCKHTKQFKLEYREYYAM